MSNSDKFSFRNTSFDPALTTINFDHVLFNLTYDLVLSNFDNILSDLFSCYVPSFPTCLRFYPIRFITETHKSIYFKHELQNVFLVSKDDTERARFKVMRYIVKTLVETALLERLGERRGCPSSLSTAQQPVFCQSLP